MRNLRVCFGIFFGEAKTDDVGLHAHFANSHCKVIRLDISMDEELCVNVLDSIDELISKE